MRRNGSNISARDIIQEQLKQKSATRLVNSPHAKYNSQGQLRCIVCSCTVKSAIVWQAHVTKKSHKENLATLKQQQEQLNQLNKRKAPFTHSYAPPVKKGVASAAQQIKGILKGIKSYASSSDSEEEPADVKPPAAATGLPSDFFDSNPKEGVQEETEGERDDDDGSGEQEAVVVDDPSGYYLTAADKAKPAAPPAPNTTEELPQGFFDDPKADAKARNVEFVDKDQAEWACFMKEKAAAEIASKEIIAEDMEEAAMRNRLAQADEQIQLYQRVIDMDTAVKQQQQKESYRTPADPDSDSDSDEDYPSLSFSWRTKHCCL